MPNPKKNSFLVNIAEVVRAEPGEEHEEGLRIPKNLFKDDTFVLTEPIVGKIYLERKENSILGTISVKTKGELSCERCLEKFEKVFKIEFDQEYVLSKRGIPKAEEKAMPVLHGKEIDVLEPVRQEILLSLPLKNLCSPSCQGLCVVCGGKMVDGVCKCK